MITRRQFIGSSAVTLASACITPEVLAQVAAKTARIIVGFPPGGGLDSVARLLANEIRNYAATIVVENRPGAGARIALEVLKTSPADGSVMALMPASCIVLYPHIFKTLNYNPQQDFLPITVVCETPYLITVGPMVPTRVKTLTDFIEWCRTNPGQATYGSPGAGSPMHFTGVMLAQAAGIEFLHVPYQGGTAGMQDLLGGRIAAYIGTVAVGLPHFQSGGARAIVTTGPQRSSGLPSVPTIREAGFPALEVTEWFGVFLPAKTPAETVNKLKHAIREALMSNEIRTSLARLYLESVEVSSGDFAQMIRSDTERWGSIVKASGFRAED